MTSLRRKGSLRGLVRRWRDSRVGIEDANDDFHAYDPVSIDENSEWDQREVLEDSRTFRSDEGGSYKRPLSRIRSFSEHTPPPVGRKVQLRRTYSEDAGTSTPSRENERGKFLRKFRIPSTKKNPLDAHTESDSRIERAADVRDLLGTLAQITGGKDKKGCVYMTILKSATQDNAKCDDIKRVVLYLASTRSCEEKEKGFGFLVLLQPTPPFGSIKPFTKLLQDSFPFKVSGVYVVKPEGYRERSLSLTNNKHKFEVNVVTKENLVKYIAREELVEDLGGTLSYQHQLWITMRTVFEKFLLDSMTLSSKLDDIKRSLLQDDFAITVPEVREQLHHHQHVRKWIEKAPIKVLAEEANRVIDVIMNTCQCENENQLKDEYKNSMFQVRGMMVTLQEQVKTLKELWLNRQSQLEQRFQFNLFKQDAEKMLAWIHENRMEFLNNYTEIGDDLEYAEELREEHKQFESSCGEVQQSIDTILQVAEKLHHAQFFDVELIDRLTTKLEQEWRKLYTAVERRSTMLDASVSFQYKSLEYLEKTEPWMEELGAVETRTIDTDEALDTILNNHAALKTDMSECYEAVSVEAKSLLSALQRPPVNETRDEKARSRVSDYTEAASHVMDRIVEMYERNKQLNITWEKTRTRINQKHKFAQFQQQCDEILKYLKGNGNNFLSKYSWVGDGLEIAEELLAEQDEFEKSFQETYTKAKKLLETSASLAEKKECDPHEIKQKATQVEAEVKLFTSKIKKRRELLKMAVNFYKNSQKLSKMTEKLKDDMNVEAASTEPQNFDEQLESHRHECESTLEKLLSTVQEGEKLSAELLQEARAPEKDNRTSWFSAGSNSPEQSRIAVEQYLKELNVNRVQLQKMWRGRQQKLDYWVKVKHFERNTNTLYLDFNKWNTLWQRKELSTDVKKAKNMVERFENEYKDISERYIILTEDGKNLEKELKHCCVEVIISMPDGSKVDGISHVAEVVKKLYLEYEVIKKINNKLKLKYEFGLKQRKLEADAKKVSGWIRHGESILEASCEAGDSMFEAEALLREYERFHAAIEKTRIGVTDIRTNAEKLGEEGHPDPLLLTRVVEQVEEKWKQLMQRAEDRRAVVFASYNFYRAADQVSKLLDKFTVDCKSDEDPCLKLLTYESKVRREKIEATIKNSDLERAAVEEGCLRVRECSDEFLKQVLPQSTGAAPTPVIDGTAGRLEIIVNDLVEQVTSQETFVLKELQLRKNVLGWCLEFAKFQEDAQTVLELITEQGTVVSEGFKQLEEGKKSDDEEQRYSEYAKIFEDVRAKVCGLMTEASQMVSKMHFHRSAISELANSIDTRYKDLLLHMKQYREQLETKFQYTLPEFEETEEWPSLSALRAQSADLSNVTRRDVSNDSGIHEMTEEKRRSVKRIEFIIKELIQTEKSYVDDLKCCIENFLIPTYNNPELPEMLQDQQHIIFGNIERIYEFHSNIFYKCLEKYDTNAENVGNAFMDWEDHFSMYVEFCANKPDSNALLIEHGETFFEDLQQNRGLGLSLAAYLIKPVQRITKYQLLLKELLSCCDSDGNLQGGLDVMLSVPRRANDAMYLSLIRGFDEGNLETLGKLLLQDSFQVYDPKHLLKKGKDQRVFLFEQALLFCKEIKDVNGKCQFAYKSKMKTNEVGLTEHIEGDHCKFAVWTGEPPLTEEKRVIKAESIAVKQMWVREVRELMQQFQFGMLLPQASFYPVGSPKKPGGKINNRKSTSVADVSINSDGTQERTSGEFDTATICSKKMSSCVPRFGKYDRCGSPDYFAPFIQELKTSLENGCTRGELYIVLDDYTAKDAHEMSLQRGQHVEMLSKPPGSRSWLVRTLDDVANVNEVSEGMVPHALLSKVEDHSKQNKRNSVDTINSQSSEDSFQQDSPKGSVHSVSSESRINRRRTKSEYMSGTFKKKTWSRSSSKKFSMTSQRPPLPTTPNRTKGTSGGGSNKLQALLGAPKEEINLLIRPSDGKNYQFATIGRKSSRDAEKVRFLSALDQHEDAGFQEDFDSDGDSDATAPSTSEDVRERALAKRDIVLKELIQSEQEYIQQLHLLDQVIAAELRKRSDIPEPLKGKEKVIFGNLPSLLMFHRDKFVQQLEMCESEPSKLALTILNSEKEFEMYIHYCANKPRSAALVYDHLRTFFDELTAAADSSVKMEELLLVPVERIMKYHAVLKDFVKYTSRAGEDITMLNKALHFMHAVPKKADDVMNIGMLTGFPGNLNNQGLLLLQDSVEIADIKANKKPVKRRLFLFEKNLVFCEPFQRKPNLVFYIYRHIVPTQTLGLTDYYDDDPCKLGIWCKVGGSSEIYVLLTRSPNNKKLWVDTIRKIIEDQSVYGKGKDGSTASSENEQDTRPRNASISSNDSSGRINPASHNVEKLSSLQHVKLIPLDQVKSNDELTKPFALQDRYLVLQNYEAKNSDEMSVAKDNVLHSTGGKVKKNATHILVKDYSKQNQGLVPVKILKKLVDGQNDLNRSSSFSEKTKKDRSSKKSKSLTSTSASLLRTASLRRKKRTKDSKDRGSGVNITEISSPRELQKNGSLHDTNSVESSDDDPVDELLKREAKTTSEVAPEFKIMPRDVTVEVACPVKLTCALVGNPPPQVSWTFNEHTPITTNERHRITFKNLMCTLEIFAAELRAAGTYSVTATNHLGSASCSAKIKVIPSNNPSAPTKPQITSVTSSSIALAWRAPEKLPAPHGYAIQQQSQSCEWETVLADCLDTSAIIESLTPGDMYRFRVVALRETGTETSEPSDAVEILPQKEYKTQRRPSEIKWLEGIEENYQVCGELGRGRFSIVKRCVHKSTNGEYAAKIVRRRIVSKETVESEIAVLQSLQHDGIVKISEIYEAPKSFVIIQEMLSGGRLFDHIVLMDNLTENLAINYIRQLLKALEYLHGMSIAHLDVKPENILLSNGGDNPRVVLCDFGEAIRLRSVPYQHEGDGEFAAPEVISNETVTLSTDMWSVGVVTYVLLSGVSPFFSDNADRLKENITEIRYKFPEDFFADISDEAKDFIEELLIRDQSVRPAVSEALSFPWLKMNDNFDDETGDKRISLFRLSAFNVRRRYQYEISHQNSLTSTQLLSPSKTAR